MSRPCRSLRGDQRADERVIEGVGGDPLGLLPIPVKHLRSGVSAGSAVIGSGLMSMGRSTSLPLWNTRAGADERDQVRVR